MQNAEAGDAMAVCHSIETFGSAVSGLPSGAEPLGTDGAMKASKAAKVRAHNVDGFLQLMVNIYPMVFFS